jgi:hypothetical protein
MDKQDLRILETENLQTSRIPKEEQEKECSLMGIKKAIKIDGWVFSGEGKKTELGNGIKAQIRHQNFWHLYSFARLIVF